MQTKSVLYAAVGAPVVVARKVGDKVSVMKDRVGQEKAARSKAAGATIEGWAAEGEKVVARVSEGKVVGEISSKVDLDQAKEHVSKLRDQLEDMLATWRTSFRPEKEKEEEKTDVKEAEKAPSTKKPAAQKPAAKKPAMAKTANKASTAEKTKSSTGAKTSSTKTEKAS